MQFLDPFITQRFARMSASVNAGATTLNIRVPMNHLADVMQQLPLTFVYLGAGRLLSQNETPMESDMTKRTTTDSPAETDDARSADTPEADNRREALANKAEKGLHKAVEAVKKPKA